MEGQPQQSVPARRVLRSPSLKRKSKVTPVCDRVTLERVLGFNISNNTSLSLDPSTGNIAYPAGCIIVIFNTKKGKQSHIFNSSKKTIICLSFAGDGKHLVTGECGHQPAVRVWDVVEKSQVAEFHAHKYGISCVAFSPNMKHIVSIGTEHDMMANVWNWRTNITVASNKLGPKVVNVAFSEDGGVFVTVGNRHVKFWYLGVSKSKIRTETVPLQGRNGILQEHQNNVFTDAVFGRGRHSCNVYVITDSGLLCQFNDKRALDRWVQLHTTGANAISIGEERIYIGCTNGIVRVFSVDTLQYINTLPYPHSLGIDLSSSLSMDSLPAPRRRVGFRDDGVDGKPTSHYADCVAVRYDEANDRLTCVYNDHSLYMWDVTDIARVGKTRSFLYHSGPVWALDVYPELGEDNVLPSGSFFTTGNDNTIRIWNCSSHVNNESTWKRNIYSNELLKILYIDPDLNNLVDKSFNPGGKKDKTDTTFQDKVGVRSLRVSHDGKHLASGDRVGNVRVHDLETMDEIASVEAHDSEVLCLEYTQPVSGLKLLATASRDRLLHVFDADQNYGLIQTFDDHSSAITSVRFTHQDSCIQMLSCGADKSLLFREANNESEELKFVLGRHLMSRTTLYDMEVDVTEKFVATACQDRNIRIYNTRNGKQRKCYSGSVGNDGTLIGLTLDPSGQYVISRCSDKNLSIHDFFTGECVASMYGHSEISTGAKFLNDLIHIVTVSIDGCVFIWRLPGDVTERIRSRLNSLGLTHHSNAVALNNTPDNRRQTFLVSSKASEEAGEKSNYLPQTSARDVGGVGTGREGGYEVSVGRLPAWAKRQMADENSEGDKEEGAGRGKSQVQPTPYVAKGRWATRVVEPTQAYKSLLESAFKKTDVSALTKDSIDGRTVDKKVPIITDDDVTNKDDDNDDEDDEFKSRGSGGDGNFGGSSPTPMLGRGVSRQSIASTDDDDVDIADAKETVYYMPCVESHEIDENSDGTFKVHQGNADKDDDTDTSSEPSENDSASLTVQDLVTPPPPHLSDVNGAGDSAFNFTDEQNKLLQQTFETLSKETFDETLRKLEADVTARTVQHDSALLCDDKSSADLLMNALFSNNRSSISARYLTGTQLIKMHRAGTDSDKSVITRSSKQSESSVTTRDQGGGGAVTSSTAAGRRSITATGPAKSAESDNRRRTVTAADIRLSNRISSSTSDEETSPQPRWKSTVDLSRPGRAGTRSALCTPRSGSPVGQRSPGRTSSGNTRLSLAPVERPRSNSRGMSKSALSTPRSSSPVTPGSSGRPSLSGRSKTPVNSGISSRPKTPVSGGPTARPKTPINDATDSSIRPKTPIKDGGLTAAAKMRRRSESSALHEQQQQQHQLQQQFSSGTVGPKVEERKTNGAVKAYGGPGSSSTLPRTRGSKPAPGSVPASGSRQVGDLTRSSAEVGSSLENLSSTVPGRRSVDVDTVMSQQNKVPAYRMATESSAHKTKDATKPAAENKPRKMVASGKFQSTPNLAQVEKDSVEDRSSAGAGLSRSSSTRDHSTTRVSLVAIAESTEKSTDDVIGDVIPSKTPLSSSSSSSSAASAQDFSPGRILMPPPSSTTVLASFQKSFIDKAEKYRRTTMPNIPSPLLPASALRNSQPSAESRQARPMSAMAGLPSRQMSDSSQAESADSEEIGSNVNNNKWAAPRDKPSSRSSWAVPQDSSAPVRSSWAQSPGYKSPVNRVTFALDTTEGPSLDDDDDEVSEISQKALSRRVLPAHPRAQGTASPVTKSEERTEEVKGKAAAETRLTQQEMLQKQLELLQQENNKRSQTLLGRSRRSESGQGSDVPQWLSRAQQVQQSWGNRTSMRAGGTPSPLNSRRKTWGAEVTEGEGGVREGEPEGTRGVVRRGVGDDDDDEIDDTCDVGDEGVGDAADQWVKAVGIGARVGAGYRNGGGSVECQKVAEDLSQAVRNATQLYNRLNSEEGSSRSSEDNRASPLVGAEGVNGSGEDMGLNLLRESLLEARSKISETLNLTDSTRSEDVQQTVVQLMDEYSQQLSNQVFQLFKSKLEQHQLVLTGRDSSVRAAPVSRSSSARRTTEQKGPPMLN